MEKVAFLNLMVLLLLIPIFVGFVRPVVAQEPIYIRSDGSIDPPIAPISSVDNVTYTFTSDIYDTIIVVERSNIIIDGNGYTLQGTGFGAGLSLRYRSNVTIKNMKIQAFSRGIGLFSSSNITISGNNITENKAPSRFAEWSYVFSGIWIYVSSNIIISENKIMNNTRGIMVDWSSNNIISGNNITENNHYGIYLTDSSNNHIYHNNFVNNTEQVETHRSTNVWDDGVSEGNYWSDYNGTDSDGDGVGDAPYVIDEHNKDNYPLMSPYPQRIKTQAPFWTQWWFWTTATLIIATFTGAIYLLKKKRKTQHQPPTLPTESTTEHPDTYSCQSHPKRRPLKTQFNKEKMNILVNLFDPCFISCLSSVTPTLGPNTLLGATAAYTVKNYREKPHRNLSV